MVTKDTERVLRAQLKLKLIVYRTVYRTCMYSTCIIFSLLMEMREGESSTCIYVNATLLYVRFPHIHLSSQITQKKGLADDYLQ
jgi:hypothetical protein